MAETNESHVANFGEAKRCYELSIQQKEQGEQMVWVRSEHA